MIKILLFIIFLILMIVVILLELKRKSFYNSESSDKEVSAFKENIKDELFKINFSGFKDLKLSKLGSSFLSIMVMTKARVGLQDTTQYFHLTINSILTSMTLEDLQNVSLSVCDLNEFPERYLAMWDNLNISIFRRPKSLTLKNIINQETLHYLWCLQQIKNSFVSQTFLLLEDDVVLNQEQFFSVLFNVQRQLSGIKEYIVKFYHPPRLLDFFQPESSRIFELFALGVLFHYFILVVIYIWDFNQLFINIINSKISRFLLFVIGIGVILLIGRWRILFLRTFHKDLHLIVSAPFCCTQAMLFNNRSLLSLLENFHISQLNRSFIMNDDTVAIDVLINDYTKTFSCPFYYVEPNIVRHIGHISSLRDHNIDPRVL